MHDATLIDLGRMEYRAAWAEQRRIAAACAEGGDDTLVLVEHESVLTLGKNFQPEHLLRQTEEYAAMGIDVVETDRGGDVTFHGPNQLVIYPVFNVKRLGGDLHRWLRDLEETVIVALREWSLEARRFPPHTGVWVGGAKIAAIGIKVSRWVSIHGIALNCDNDLSPFELIVPCGIAGYGVTSISREVGERIGILAAKPAVVRAFEEVFDIRLVEAKNIASERRLEV